MTRGHAHPTRRHHHMLIYRSAWQLAATFLFIVVPIIFLLAFAHFARLNTATLFSDLAISTARLTVAYVISALFGWLFAVMFFRGPISVVALPVMDVLQSFPTYAVLPLAVIVWGPTNFTVITFLVLEIVWPIFFSTISSLKLIRGDWEEAVEISGLTRWHYIEHFLIPISLPGMITGSIVGLGDGWQALVATEIIVQTRNGLGTFFQSVTNDTTVTWLAVLGLLLVIFSINKIIWLPLLEYGHKMMSE